MTLHLIRTEREVEREAAAYRQDGCPIDGNHVEEGHKLCALCEADEKRAAEFARQLVDDFLFLPARMSREGR